MDEKPFDPKKHSIDEICEHFEIYKKRCEDELERSNKRIEQLCISHINDLNVGLRHLAFSGLPGEDEIEVWQTVTTDLGGDGDGDVSQTKTQENVEDEEEKKEEEMVVISCGSSECLFDNCHRRVDSQLLLLHYLYDHDNDIAAANRCHQVREGQRAKLCFEPRTCQLKQNQVIGLLAYAGTLMQQHQKLFSSPSSSTCTVYNSFLPKQHKHLKSDVPVVVLICKTTAIIRKHKKPTHRVVNVKDQVFVIWLVTPNDQLQLNATLCLYGRDAAIQTSTIVAVRMVQHSQDTCRFMPVDANYWRISFEEMQKISNDFRDELYLEVSFTEPTDNCSV